MDRHKINYIVILKIRKLLFLKYASDMITSIINIMFPIIIGKIIETVFYRAEPKLFIKWGAAYTIVFVLKKLCDVNANILHVKMNKKFLMNLKSLLYQKMLSGKADSIESLTSGDAVYTLTGDVENVFKFYNETLSNILNAMVQIIGIILIMSVYHRGLAIIILLFSAAVVVSSDISKQNFGTIRTEYRKNLGKYLEWITEHLAGMKDIRMNQAEKQVEHVFSKKTEAILKQKENIRFAEMKAERIYGLISSVFTILFWTVSAFMIIGNSLTVGLFYMINQYFNMMIEKLENINQERLNTYSFQSSFEKLENYFHLTGERTYNTSIPQNYNLSNQTICFDKVSFSYGEKPVLNHVTCSIHPGKISVVVGENGVGKTTLLNLLLRFYTEYEGNITVGNQCIEEIPVSLLREQMGYVQQNSIILSGTLKENIRLYNSLCSDTDIWNSLQLCGMKDTVMSWEKQLETDLNYGERLSGGQRQKIALARMVIKNPSIILMDEPTASLDYHTEKQILEDMRRIFKEKLVLIVSHRVEVAKSADHILVIKNGLIIAEGVHQTLVTKCSYYASLFA